MNTTATEMVAFDNSAHRDQVVRLWERVFGYEAPHNAPALVIDKKLAAADGLFFVALTGGAVVGTVMAGYDGHRGWIYSMAVHPDHRKRAIFSASDSLPPSCIPTRPRRLAGSEGLSASATKGSKCMQALPGQGVQ